MACKVAENAPLNLLQSHLGIPPKCHSFRKKCISGLESADDSGVLAIQGAVLGYCQALFSLGGSTPEIHTKSIISALTDIGAPWLKSHELYLGYKPDHMKVDEYVRASSKPLSGGGRIPILITGLSANNLLVDEIIEGQYGLSSSETMLFRLILEDAHVDFALNIIERLIYKAQKSHKMPEVWPLFQSNLTFAGLMKLRAKAGSNWKYFNFAVSPFNGLELVEFSASNVVVAQWAISSFEEIYRDGTISFSDKVSIFGSNCNSSYNVSEFAETIKKLPIPPTNILLGPSKADWGTEYNSSRIEKFLDISKLAIQDSWNLHSDNLENGIWFMPA